MMYPSLKDDLANLEQLLTLTKDAAFGYLNDLAAQSPSLAPPKKSATGLPADGAGLQQTLNAFYKQYYPLITAASGPRYWGYVVGGTTPAAIAGDWLTTAFDQNPQGLNSGGDVSAVIELQTIELLLDLFGLPKAFKGGFVTGATMSNFTCLAVGRQWAGLQNNNDIAREGLHTNIKVLTATPHSSSLKSLAMLGIGSNNIVPVKVMEGNREAMDIADLEAQLIAHQADPVIVISSAGTVNTVDFDDLQAIAALHKKHAFYWHVDAAFGAFAACASPYRHLLSGWELADSITIDCHKWLNVPYDSAIYLVNEQHAKLQLQTFQNGNAPYLGDPETDFNYLNAGPENSRRLRALPAWFTLNAYGRNGYRWIVENNIALAQQFGGLLETQTIFKLAAPVRLNVVCFTVEGPAPQQKIKQVLAALNQEGKVFITPTVYKGIHCLRAAFVNWRTTPNDLLIAIESLINASRDLSA